MIQATLRGREILITSDAQAATTAARIPGATRNARMPPLTWTMPFTLDGIQELRNVKAMASPGLIKAVKEAGEVARYVELVKTSGELAPLLPVPVKPGITLYQHQVKAFNIALAQFGYDIHHGEGSPCQK